MDLSLVTRNAEVIPWRPALRAPWERSLGTLMHLIGRRTPFDGA
ncbi:hypothetical protein PZ938_17310 [Luteipulveratus sp. YIM 133132]|nr:hypothetical protein [Luteipulveratus sp. YIM 133132]MDE9367381.1 hypothetical protein [Luteipulveratus sp. YIM 133132]